MKGIKLLAAFLVMTLVFWGAGSQVAAATDGYYQVAPDAYIEFTSANRYLPETSGVYQFDYGEEGSVTFTLPWLFSYYGQRYSQITADTEGNIWFGSTIGSGPVLRAWNTDLNSYYSGGVFVQHLSDPDRVVVQWKSETFAAAGAGHVNDVVAVLFSTGDIRFVFNGFSPLALDDDGSGVFAGDGVHNLNLTTLYGAVPTLVGTSFLVTSDTGADADGDGMNNGWESDYGFDPLNPADAAQDADGDGLSNGWEFSYGFDPLNPSDAVTDYDGDGMSNLDECMAGTDPTNADTDGDGVADGQDLYPTEVPALTLSPASLYADESAEVALTVNYLAVPNVLIEQVIDVNRNGTVDADEPVVRFFQIADGVVSTNPNVPGDEDGEIDGQINTPLNFLYLLDKFHAPGEYLFRVAGSAESTKAGFIVTPVSGSQTIAGTVTDGTDPIPGALVRLVDKWQRPVAWGIADDLGQFLFNVAQPGEYQLIPMAPGYAAARVDMPLLTLPAGGTVSGLNLTLTAGVHHLQGQVYDQVSGLGIAGVSVGAEGDDYLGRALNDAEGNFELFLPTGTYDLRLAADESGPALKGYAGAADQVLNIDLTGDLLGADFVLNPANFLVQGNVTDSFGLPLPGLPVQATAADSIDASAYAITGADGSYALALPAGEWAISLDDRAAQSLGYLGNRLTGVTTTGTLTGHDLTAQSVDAWVTGTVMDTALAPLAGVMMTVQSLDGNLASSVPTAADGTYRLGTYTGDWLVRAVTEAKGYLPTPEQIVTLSSGQTATVDFLGLMNDLPDLVVTSVDAPAEVMTGATITVSNSVSNHGTILPSFYVGIYLSADATITTSDVYLGCRIVSSLAPGASSAANTNVLIPNTLAAGTYYIGAIADYSNAVTESDETNNAFAGNQIVVTGPDLTMSSVSAPASALTGETIAVNNTVTTTGGSSGFYVRTYLSADAAITTSDVYLGYRIVSSLAPGASSAANTSVLIPNTLAAGTYYIGAIADYSNAVVESDETNNTLAGNQIVITGPDLTMSSVSAPASALTGGTIAVNNTVTTTGGSSGFYVGLYLSADATITTTDVYLSKRIVSSLAPGASSAANTNVLIPTTLPAGTYYIGAIADYSNAVNESDETNNALAGNQIVVTGP